MWQEEGYVSQGIGRHTYFSRTFFRFIFNSIFSFHFSLSNSLIEIHNINNTRNHGFDYSKIGFVFLFVYIKVNHIITNRRKTQKLSTFSWAILGLILKKFFDLIFFFLSVFDKNPVITFLMFFCELKNMMKKIMTQKMIENFCETPHNGKWTEICCRF